MKKALTFFSLVVMVSYYIYSYQSWLGQDYFRVIFFDVGQGDSALIVTPRGQTILIDGGPDNKVLRELGLIMPFWQHQIDFLILTHQHDDHLFGLAELSRRYIIKVFLNNKIDYQKPIADYLQESLAEDRTKIITAEAGMIFKLDSGCSLSVLEAAKSAKLLENDYSIVASFDCLGRKVLLTGDAGIAIEKNLTTSGLDDQVDILKVSHHGSASANSLAFLELIKPKVAVISVGKDNNYNHPAPIIIDRLKTLSVDIYRTDESGTLEFLANNKIIKLIKRGK